ncbi:oligosaccharide flippase family protein [Qipengyuania nanhaisediminis]|uniref:oligosaccharide flippase family protein n=1 Tax=Qipengyuania nanhaisediminis TaxID=604088 RepID=UPI0038B39CDE
MLARNSAISITGSIIPVIVTIATLPALLSAIGVERYGALAICWLILIYVGQADWGLGKAATYRVARLGGRDEPGIRETMTTAILTAIVVGTVMAVLASAVSWVFFAHFFDVSESLRAELLDCIGLIGAATLATSLLQVMYGVLAGRERFASATAAMTLSNASLPVLALATALLIEASMPALMVATVLGRAVGVLLAGIDIWLSQIRGHKTRFSMDTALKLLGFGFWIMASSFTAPVLVTIDRMIIGSTLGAAAVSAYTIPYQIVSRLQLVPQSLMNVVFPRLSVAQGAEARKTAAHYAVTISALFLPIVIGLIFVFEPLLELWLGDALDDRSILVGKVLLCAFLFTAIAQSIAVFLQSQNQGRFVASFQLGEIVPYVIVLVFSAGRYGLLGVAGAFLLRRIIETIFFVARSGYGSCQFWLSQVPAILGVVAALYLEPQLTTLSSRLALGTLIGIAAFGLAAVAAPRDLRQGLSDKVRQLLPGS